MADNILTNYTESGPIVANGTVGTTPTEIIIRSPAEQRVALDVYSTEQVNSIFLPLSGGSLFGDLNMDNYSIHGVHAPTAASDAANKQYVDVTALAVSGGNTMAAPINMGGNRVVSMADPVAAGDAATRRYVDTSTLALSGLNAMTGPLKMGGNVISSVGTPVFAGDAANKLYVDNTAVALTGDTMNGVLNMNYNPITLVGTPVSAGDATNKYYVDSAVALGVASVSNGVGYLPLTGTSAMVGAFDMGTHAIRNVVTSSSSPATDAANKQYVDSQDAGNLAAAKSYTDTKALPITGTLAMTGALNMGTQKITNLDTPSAATDAANKSYTDTQDALKLSLTGGTLTGPLIVNNNRITCSFSPSATSDVTNKTYVDTQVSAKLSLTGSSAMSGALNMGTKLINNLATPLAATDAATKAYVDTTAAGYVPLTSGTLTNATLAGASSTITGTLTCSGAGKITGVPTPSAASDAVPKSYADLLVAGLTFKPAVACYTTLAAPLNTFVYNGGHQITISLAATPIDGYTLQLNDRVLVNCAGTQAANGVYLVTQLASPITLVRPADLDGSPLSEFQQGGLFYVTNGTVFGGSLFVQSSASPSIIGTSTIVYSQYSAAKNIAAGPNIAITGNSVAVTPSLSGITGVGLNAGDGTTGVVTVGKASGAASYALALPSAAPASNTFLKYDGANYSWSAAGSPLTGGSNINITSNAVGLNVAVSGLTSVGINGTSSSDAVTLSKATGGASYTLALPAAAPAANTYLQYTGTNYAWGAGTNSATQYCLLLITQAANSNIPFNTNITFDFQQVSSGLSFTMPTSTFVLQPTCSYKLTGCLPNGVNGTQPAWYNVTTEKYIGTIGTGTNQQSSSAPAIAYVICTVATTVALRSGYSTGTMGLLANANVGQYGWATIEVVSNNTAISQFTGATSIADGAIGYIPKPLTGQQNYVLTGAGSWQEMPAGVTGTIFQSVLNTKQLFIPGAGWATVPNLAINVTPPSITTKYLLSANLLVGNLTSTIAFRFMRGSTIIGVGSGDTNQGSFRVGNDTPTDHTKNAIGTYLDSPATTSSIIYTLQALAYDSSRGCYFNNLNTGNMNVDNTCCISTLTAQQC